MQRKRESMGKRGFDTPSWLQLLLVFSSTLEQFIAFEREMDNAFSFQRSCVFALNHIIALLAPILFSLAFSNTL